MFGRKKLTIPGHLKPRLTDVASAHDFDSGDALGLHLVEARLKQYDIPQEHSKNLKAQLNYLVEEHGYSSRDEAIEHLLERGLRAYEEPVDSPEELEQRLRGLGYIE